MIRRISILHWQQWMLACLIVIFFSNLASAQPQNIAPYTAGLGSSDTPMTLWQIIVAGGWTMIFIGILSLAGLALVVYDFMTLDVNKLAPRKFCDELIGTLEEGSLKSVKEMCSKNNNIISRIALSGIEKNQKGKGGIVVKEAMENTARIEIGNLWQNISYLSDIAQIAPLLGLLGTVLGMIQAFTVIVVQSAGVKPVMLAAGVSKAMITTAAGLIVAIPVLLFYAYFRGKVQEITNVVDTYSSDIIKIMEKL